MLGLPWEMLRFSCMSFLHEMRDSFSRIKRGFVSFSFQNMAHTAFWTLLGFLASLTQLEAMQKNTTLPHKTFVHSLCKRPNPIKPSGLRLQRVFCRLKGRQHCLPFCFCTVFIPRQKWLSSHRSSAQHAHNPQPRLLQTPLHAWPRQQPRSSLF